MSKLFLIGKAVLFHEVLMIENTYLRCAVTIVDYKIHCCAAIFDFRCRKFKLYRISGVKLFF
jgi:hypothetical protein